MGEFVCYMTEVDGETWETEVRERIVRCRDCKKFEEWAGITFCHRFDRWPVAPGGFCAWGEESGDDR